MEATTGCFHVTGHEIKGSKSKSSAQSLVSKTAGKKVLPGKRKQWGKKKKKKCSLESGIQKTLILFL